MRKKSLAVAAGLLIISMTAGAFGQNKDGIPDPNAPINPKKANAIRHLLELTGSDKLGRQMWDQMLRTIKPSAAQVPSSVWDEMAAEFEADLNGGKLTELIVPIYNRAFSEEDINELVKFYESPLGKKMIKALPQILSESMIAGEQWAGEVLKRLRTRLKEKGYSVSAD